MTSNLKGKQLWGSRFSKVLSEAANDFNSSLPFDNVLYPYDIAGSIAHVSMLADQNIVDPAEKNKIISALNEILNDIKTGKVQFSLQYEDIHSFIEKQLIEKIGDIGKKVHTARSRNDQVALDIRLYLKDKVKNIQKLLLTMISVLLEISEKHIETIMPGYTHLQRAQPITFAHHLGAYIEMFKRDFMRLGDVYKRINILPLGAGALAGTPHNIDRYKTAQYLDFDGVCLNSLDAVSDRDFVIETISALSIIMMHLSRMSEEIILWASFEYKFIDLDDAFSTGSSMMPQKKNPDIAELTRGKTGRVYGNLITILTVMKSLPLAYNKDMQEDKEALFDAVNTVSACLSIMPEMIASMKVKKENMLKAVREGFLNATDAADYLVKKGLPFRDAHNVIGKIVSDCAENKKNLEDLSIEEFKGYSDLFDDDIYDAINPVSSVNSKKVIGGPSFEFVKKVIEMNKKWVQEV